MTRVKLACKYDMGVVCSATPVLNWKDRVGKEAKMQGGFEGARGGE